MPARRDFCFENRPLLHSGLTSRVASGNDKTGAGGPHTEAINAASAAGRAFCGGAQSPRRPAPAARPTHRTHSPPRHGVACGANRGARRRRPPRPPAPRTTVALVVQALASIPWAAPRRGGPGSGTRGDRSFPFAPRPTRGGGAGRPPAALPWAVRAAAPTPWGHRRKGQNHHPTPVMPHPPSKRRLDGTYSLSLKNPAL